MSLTRQAPACEVPKAALAEPQGPSTPSLISLNQSQVWGSNTLSQR